MSLTRDEFNLALANRVEETFSDLFKVERTSVLKNNNTQRDCIVVRQGDLDAAAIIYTDDMFREYTKGRAFEDIVKQVIILVGRQNEKKHFNNFAKSFVEWPTVKGLVYFRLVGHTGNEEYLSDKPFVKQNDLALVFAVYVDGFAKDGGIASVVITKQHMKNWKINICDLLSAAIENTPKLFPVKFESIDNVLKGIFENVGYMDNQEEYDIFAPMTDVNPMYVLSNEMGINGAAAMYYPGVLKGIADKLNWDKLMILPSSIHEVIIVEWYETCSAEEMSGMVSSINTNEVQSEEVLSNNVYVYDRKTDKVTIMR